MTHQCKTCNTCNTCGVSKPVTEFPERRKSCTACMSIVQGRGRKLARLTASAKILFPYITTWRTTQEIAAKFDRSRQSLGSTLRRLLADDYVVSRENPSARGGLPQKEYMLTEKGMRLSHKHIDTYTYRHPWEALGEDCRPDWKSDTRYVPAPTKNQTFII